jgi:hypothetical protein
MAHRDLITQPHPIGLEILLLGKAKLSFFSTICPIQINKSHDCLNRISSCYEQLLNQMLSKYPIVHQENPPKIIDINVMQFMRFLTIWEKGCVVNLNQG